MNTVSLKASLSAVTLIVFLLILTPFLFPVETKVEGVITDWLGNDNGFGLQIDGIVYWLDYGGEINTNISMPSWVGHRCVLIYQSNIIGSRGSPFLGAFYAHLISLKIQEKIKT